MAPSNCRILVERTDSDERAERNQSHCQQPIQCGASGDAIEEDVIEDRARDEHDHDDSGDGNRHPITSGPVAGSWVGGPDGGDCAHDLSTRIIRRAKISTGTPLAQRSTTNMYWPGRLYFKV